MSKTELRREYLARRRAVSPSDAAHWSVAIQARVLALPELRGDATAYIYLSLPDEADTRAIIETLLAQDRRVVAPVPERGTGALHWGEVRSLDALRPGAYGLLEPTAISIHATDAHRGVAIVPCVAFTATGDRLGRGGGYYDRFLVAFDGPSIALAYECQRAEVLTIEPHDVRVSRIVTESRVYP